MSELKTPPSFEAIERRVLVENAARADQAEYQGSLMVRQGIINENIAQFCGKYLQSNDRVLDACAGPSGLLLPGSKRGWKVISNEIAAKSALALKKIGAIDVTQSAFGETPLANESLAGIFLVFALNNVGNISNSLEQAKRTLRPGGLLVIADPGPSFWIRDLLFYSLFRENPEFENVFKHKVFRDDVQHFFRTKKRLFATSEDFREYYARSFLNVGPEELAKLASLSFVGRTRKKEKIFAFQDLVSQLYFQNITDHAGQEDFVLDQAGLMLARLPQPNPGETTKKDWDVSQVVKADTNDWLNDLRSLRHLKKTEVKPYIDRGLTGLASRSSQRISFPVLCYLRGKS